MEFLNDINNNRINTSENNSTINNKDTNNQNITEQQNYIKAINEEIEEGTELNFKNSNINNEIATIIKKDIIHKSQQKKNVKKEHIMKCLKILCL